jgi:alkanesulfonate monooxygenase SsuD/methylene tetrahydromethanopterin reductase-like flavin-dependent oxidoreductase (luciferase family)
VIRGLLDGGSVNLDGDVIRITDGRLRFLARANIEIAVAAEGPRMTEVAGSWADAVIFAHTASPAGIAWRTEVANLSARRMPTPLRTIARLDVTVSDSGEAARRMARIRAGRVLWSQYPAITYVERLGLTLPADLDRRLREAGPFQRTQDLAACERFADVIPDDLVRPIAVAGTEQEVASQFSELIETGVDELMVHPLVVQGQDLSDSIDGIARAYHMARNAQALQ